MIHIDLSADVAGASAFLTHLREKRAATAVANALNSVAEDSRDAVRQEMPRNFTIRRPWVLRGIGVEYARPTRLRAAVFSRDAFMKDQEEGGVRSGGSSQIIALGRLAAIKSSRVLSKSQQPKALMAKKNVFYEGGTLFERRGKDIEPLFLFRKQVRIRPRFGMAVTVRSTALRLFGAAFDRALQRELASS